MTRLFGTNGVRGIVGKTLTPELALRLGRALGTTLRAGDTVAVGRDARTSGPMLQAAVTAGLHATGVHTVDLGILPTPALQYAVKTGDYAGGVMVTASHNPPEYNGLKVVAPDGTEASREQEERIEQVHFANRFRSAEWDKVGGSSADGGATARYVDAILAQVDVAAIQASGLKVVLDAGGGAGCEAASLLLDRLGVEATKLSCTFDGGFTDRPSEPVPANATRCIEAVRETGAHVGVLLDGDADRAVFITESGEYVWGDQGLAVLVRDELKRRGGGVVCTPVSTSTAVADVTRMANGEVVWTPVGSPVVAREMLAREAAIGGEDNGGIILARHQHCRDALMATTLLLDILARTRRTLGDLVSDVPRYALWKDKVVVPDQLKANVLERAMREIPAWEGVRSTDTRDGLKAFFDNGWVLVRPSGTEPIFRVQSEGPNAQAAEQLGQRVKTWLQQVRGPLVMA